MKRVLGARISLRLAEVEDAHFIHGLRSDPRYNQYLSPVSSVDDQREWIRRYKLREGEGVEFYFVIEANGKTPCGVVRLYDIDATSFVWGSWVLDDSKPAMAAVDSAVASFGFGFEELSLGLARFEALRGNTHAIRFYKRFGVPVVAEDERSLYFEYEATQFFHDRPKWLALLQESSE